MNSDALVFFGASGDLAYKEIFPALQAMVKRGTLTVPVIGVAKSDWSTDQLRERAKDSLKHHGSFDPAAFAQLSQLLHYVDGDYGDNQTFAAIRRELGQARRPLHYLAIPPSQFSNVVQQLHASGCADQARIAVEKPFGRNLETARELNTTLHGVFPESAIFRIDHFLGKEPMLSLFYFRFSNFLAENVLNRDYVESVQITMAEDFGIQGRGKFYDENGAIRDVIQNHLLQLTAILAMDSPVGQHTVESIRDEKVRLLHAITPFDPKNIVRGQFRGYLNEKGVASGSIVETYAAIAFNIDSDRWAGVPFLLRAGKCLATNAIEVHVQLKKPIRDLFGEISQANEYLRFRLGPDRTALSIGLRVKRKGEAMIGRDVEITASESEVFDMLPYERLLGDALKGDASLFAREDEVEAQWKIVDPVLDLKEPPILYDPGSWGPKEAERLTANLRGGWQAPHAVPRAA